MSSFTHPYARAFVESAPAGYDIPKFLSAAAALTAAIEGTPTLRAFLATPAVPLESKRGTVAALAAKAGLDAFGARFFEVLLRNHRILESAEILKALREAHDARQGIVRGRVTVAEPIGEAERAAIEAAVAARVGGKVSLAVDVDPTILAGFVAHVASNVFDASAAAAVRRFQEQAKLRTGA
jgi:ATP synthase F1 delta subunit